MSCILLIYFRYTIFFHVLCIYISNQYEWSVGLWSRYHITSFYNAAFKEYLHSYMTYGENLIFQWGWPTFKFSRQFWKPNHTKIEDVLYLMHHVSVVGGGWGCEVDYAKTSHPSSEYLTSFLYGNVLYAQDTQYFPGVTSSVIHGPLVSYRIIISFYYCIDLDRHIPIHMYTIYIKTDGSENE